MLVTHRTDLCQGLTTQWVEVAEGRAHAVDIGSVHTDNLSRTRSLEAAQISDKPASEEQEKAAVPEKFIEDEKREHGGVKASVYWEYIKAGQIKWWSLMVCQQILARLVDLGETWFLKEWGESYNRPMEMTSSAIFDDLPSPEKNIKPWLLGFFGLATAQAIMYFISRCVMLIIIYAAGRRMFRDIMNSVSHAMFRFYDVTPVGRLMNRMTSDIGTIDGDISSQFSFVAWLLIRWISSIAIIASVTPVFLVFALVLTATFAIVFNRFLPTSQSLRRLEVRRFT